MVFLAGRSAGLAALAARGAGLLVFAGTLVAQADPAKPVDPVDPAAKVAAAAERWLASDQTSRELLESTVAALLVDAAVGCKWLGDQLPAAQAKPAEPRSKGVTALATHFALEFVRKASASGVRFAGQYAVLGALQPFVGELCFGLLLQTPEWYPHTHRIQLVPVLRDIHEKAPSPERIEQVIAVVENKAIEPEDLRAALACMLWQWGRREYAQARLDALVLASTEGDPEERLQNLRELAELQYVLRDYRASAATHRTLQSLASSSKVPLRPSDYYSAACVCALTDNVERGIAMLEKCAQLQASPDVDSSHKLARSLFETDPEIALLRKDARFAAILALATSKLEPATEARGR